MSKTYVDIVHIEDLRTIDVTQFFDCFCWGRENIEGLYEKERENLWIIA